MARQGISFDEVAAAADALVGDGQQPTIRAVRERLGNTGSPNTIHRHLAAWREARPAPAPATAQELPQSLTAAIAAEIERSASRARAEIEAKLVQAQEEAAELAQAGEALEADREDLTRQVTALTQERDTLAGKADQQAADLADAQQRITREQQAAESARVELATTRLKIEAQADRLGEQHAEIERLRTELAEARQVRIAAEQQAAVLTAQLDAARAAAEQAKQAAADTIAALTAQVDTARAETTQALTDRDTARREAAEAREQAARCAGQLETLQAQQGKGDKNTDAPAKKQQSDQTPKGA